LDTSDKNKAIASVRRQAAAGGLRFEAYLPPGLAEWVIRILQKGIDSMKEGGGIPAEEVMARLRKKMEGPRAEPTVWDKALDRPLFPED